MDQIAREKGWHRFEWIHRKADGEEFPVEVTLNSVEIDGKPALIAVWHDLTEIKKNEKRLSELAGELRSKNEELSSTNDRMRMELETAAEAQRTLLPHASPFFAGIRTEWVFKPSQELAGDILNVFRIDEKRLGVYVLDVTGHGVSSALLSVTVSQFLTSFVNTASSGASSQDFFACPASIANRLNSHFSVNRISDHFFTLVYGVLDTESLRFSYVAAGQAGPVIARKNGSAELCETTGMPIGFLDGIEYESRETQLLPGDRIYLFSDGLYEAKKKDGEEYGLTRLKGFLDMMKHFPFKEAVKRFIGEAEHWAYPDPLHDDASIVAIEIDKSGVI
jgi:sigma-B regulation protein RsbU (phosphoserine phosphatase)